MGDGAEVVTPGGRTPEEEEEEEEEVGAEVGKGAWVKSDGRMSGSVCVEGEGEREGRSGVG